MMTDLSTHPTQIAGAWLADFSTALERADIDAAVALFEPDAYWRDLVAFTWNIRTQEGLPAIRAMLAARLADTRPSAFAVEGDATAADGLVDAWFTFETAVARGRGHLRLRGGKAWTLLTTMIELKGFEEKTGGRRVKGASSSGRMRPLHSATPSSLTLSSSAAGRAALHSARDFAGSVCRL